MRRYGGYGSPEPVQQKAIGDAPSDAVHSAAQHGTAGSGGLLPYLERIQSSFGAHDVSDVQAHVAGAATNACDSMGAQAYASGNSVAFRDSPDLHTAAHEAAHVVQQRGSLSLPDGVGQCGDRHEKNADAVADVVVRGESAERLLGSAGGLGHARGRDTTQQLVQLRRVPEAGDLASLLPPGGANADAHSAGLHRILMRASSEMTQAERMQAFVHAVGGATMINIAAFLALSVHEQLQRIADGVRTVRPDLVQGDPALIDVGARPATADATNIATLVTNANNIFTAIAGSSHDTSIGQVFGTSNVSAAKTKYAAAHARMNQLHASDKIVTDRSGYNAEVGLGGLTSPAQIMVGPGILDVTVQPLQKADHFDQLRVR